MHGHSNMYRNFGEVLTFAFSALRLLVGRQEGHTARKKTEWWDAGVVICLGRGADFHMAQRIGHSPWDSMDSQRGQHTFRLFSVRVNRLVYVVILLRLKLRLMTLGFNFPHFGTSLSTRRSWCLFCGCEGRDGGHGSEGQLRRRRGTEQARHPDAQVPHRARHRDQLGRHGEDLAPHVLQRAACRPGGAPSPAHRGATQPQGQPRKDDTGQSPGNLRLSNPRSDIYHRIGIANIGTANP